MFAMQYGFNLTDEDQLSIRSRVHEIGARFDNLPGLYQKAFLMAERIGNSRNRYTPFYLWNSIDGMTDFLLSESFGRVETKWGRPVARRWNSLCHVQGDAAQMTPHFAIQQHIDVPQDVGLAGFCAKYRDQVGAMAGLTGLHSAFLGIDTETWRLMAISLWTDEAAANHHADQDGERYEILYLSTQRPSTGS